MDGKVVAVVGNTGVGKTTLAGRLQSRLGLAAGIEQHQERPFQQRFADDRRGYALPNQIDYLLFRAEQERAIRLSGRLGILDGGLDLDFHVFTRLFFERGYLDPPGYDLCRRLYLQLRDSLPVPELTIWMKAPLETVAARFAARRRALSIATVGDLPDLERFLADWLCSGQAGEVVTVEVGGESPAYDRVIDRLTPRLAALA